MLHYIYHMHFALRPFAYRLCILVMFDLVMWTGWTVDTSLLLWFSWVNVVDLINSVDLPYYTTHTKTCTIPMNASSERPSYHARNTKRSRNIRAANSHALAVRHTHFTLFSRSRGTPLISHPLKSTAFIFLISPLYSQCVDFSTDLQIVSKSEHLRLQFNITGGISIIILSCHITVNCGTLKHMIGLVM